MKNMMLFSQCRAGRALLGWTQDQLAQASKVGIATIRDFERGVRRPYERTLHDLQIALEQAGIEFIDRNGGGVGVRFRDADRVE